MLTAKQRAFLRAQATAIDTAFQIGKGGVKETMLSSIEDALRAHEIVKIKLLENCEYTPKEAIEGISAAIDAEQVQVIGNKIVLFKISPEHRIYDLDKLAVIETKKEDKKKTPAGRPAGGRSKTAPTATGGKKSGGRTKTNRPFDPVSGSARQASSRPPKPRFDFEIQKKK